MNPAMDISHWILHNPEVSTTGIMLVVQSVRATSFQQVQKGQSDSQKFKKQFHNMIRRSV